MADQQLVEQCIKDCLERTNVASRCVNERLSSEQVNSLEACIRLSLDRADVTDDCAGTMGRNSSF